MTFQFSAAAEAQLAGATVGVTPLVMMDFRDGPLGLWPGHGKLVAGGDTYWGISNLGRMSSVSSGPGGSVEELKLDLFATSPMIAAMKSDAAQSAGREAVAKFQFFEVRETDEAGNYVRFNTLDDPWEFFWGRMGPLTLDTQPVRAGDTRTRTLSTVVQNAFINRNRPVVSFFSHRDQLARTGGTDLIFIRAAQMASVRVRWPKF